MSKIFVSEIFLPLQINAYTQFTHIRYRQNISFVNLKPHPAELNLLYTYKTFFNKVKQER